jgi:hypothetical protein
VSWLPYPPTTSGDGKLPGYFPVYERHLGKFRNTAANVLEVGVWQGTSMKLWKQFFGPDACIAGIDKNRAFVEHDDPGYVKVYTGDQADQQFLADVEAEAGPFDVVIDDGSHEPSDMKATFEYLYPLMGRNGVYVVEDTHTQQPGDEGSFLEYAKGLTDALNSRYWPGWNPEMVNDFVRNTRSVHFYESMVVFERGRSPVYKTWTGVPKGS